ncbi:hypothetical protein BABINDRAFT_164860 [Babjeviella inositovora NRRL Y-12698]|uniref:Uncharacterized protein n=1 Tax=Babjeviella inositovora NRRL Y-12698 TaxID=984486 RepID=A0A1E3QZY9_9ASCO|nr:uncharacterized protein BABINDRAFT_164860 [Babjeviella inositovora NRRL Y-12698]ODQ83155.1 hypothetical protein BABINDRAFT_164860 [Babjeviella inositovora NRRL Y-12698]
MSLISFSDQENNTASQPKKLTFKTPLKSHHLDNNRRQKQLSQKKLQLSNQENRSRVPLGGKDGNTQQALFPSRSSPSESSSLLLNLEKSSNSLAKKIFVQKDQDSAIKGSSTQRRRLKYQTPLKGTNKNLLSEFDDVISLSPVKKQATRLNTLYSRNLLSLLMDTEEVQLRVYTDEIEIVPTAREEALPYVPVDAFTIDDLDIAAIKLNGIRTSSMSTVDREWEFPETGMPSSEYTVDFEGLSSYSSPIGSPVLVAYEHAITPHKSRTLGGDITPVISQVLSDDEFCIENAPLQEIAAEELDLLLDF